MLSQGSATLPQHILVVDDHADICAVVRIGLEELGHYRVSTARSGDHALSLLDSDPPDLVLLDAILPGMTGMELAACAVERDIPVLLMTGEAATEDRLERVGWPHLRKPFHLDELILEVRHTISKANETMLRIRESLDRLFRTTGDLHEAIERMVELRRRLQETTERSRRFDDHSGGC